MNKCRVFTNTIWFHCDLPKTSICFNDYLFSLLVVAHVNTLNLLKKPSISKRSNAQANRNSFYTHNLNHIQTKLLLN